jgi:hypothetical protein
MRITVRCTSFPESGSIMLLDTGIVVLVGYCICQRREGITVT